MAAYTSAALCDIVETYTGNVTANAALVNVQSGYERALRGGDPRDAEGAPHLWSFLRPTATITVWPTTVTAAAVIWATTTTGAVTVSGVGNLILTVAADTFYENMVGETIVSVIGENSYTITGYTSAKIITVATDASADDGDTFTITAADTDSGTNIWVDADTFYESMIGKTIVAVTSGTEYTIVGYTDSENITVDSDASADNGDTFTITANGFYRLPSDFNGLLGPPVYVYPSGAAAPAMEEVSPQTIFEMWRNSETVGTPQYYALMPDSFSTGVLQTFSIIFAAQPTAARTFRYRYRVSAPALADTATYPMGPPAMWPLYRDAALADAERITGQTRGPHEVAYQRSMIAAIDGDAAFFQTSAPARMGSSQG
ncbi:MAG TPA: hypothetical protein VMY35_12210 [Phycisphaerae bacterium]|nr:hypothetical protein [Phycisphaerae bacterium]